MRCPLCQHENEAGAKFCEECAAPLVRACAKCGRPLSATAKFCPECAYPTGLSAAPSPAQRFGSPESYTPKHLAERILTSKSALEGERKQVTVLFADLKGSMELLADRDPEEARKILDPVLERMMEAVHHYEGTVNQVMGDGIMALFGAPIGHEDHAIRACYAALRMQRRVHLYADEIQRGGGTPIYIRVGLNSGEVVVGSIGSDLHMDYTAVGQTTHLAARMEQMAKPGSALVTGETLKLAGGYVQVRSLGDLTVKGLGTPTPVYELTGIAPARSRFQASAARGLARFVGRESELQQLAQALERAATGHGQTVAVVGEAGVGKSRLVWEFARSHHTHGWLVLESSSVSYGKATPYLPVIDLLKAYCRIQERDDQRAIRERVAGKLLMLDRALEPLLTPLLALLDVPVDDAAWEALEPPQRRQRTLEAVKRLLLRESQVQPLLVIFEDLHWIDSETQALLDGLIESLPTARVLLLVNYRPEYQHAWGGKTYYLQLRIDPLPPANAEELLEALLGQDRALDSLKQILIQRTEGNPFFLEESVQSLVETRVLVGERGAYRITKAPGLLQIPATAQALLAARIDRLPPEDKRLLQAASVIGKDVLYALLRAIADVPEDGLRRGLSHLQAAEFLYEASLFPDLEYTFKHALTHEVAYGSVLQERRRALHARIVEAIETLYPDRLVEHTERLAHHAVRGELHERAVQYLRQAGAKAASRVANREAAAHFEQALEVLARRPGAAAPEAAIDIRLELRNCLHQLGELGRIRELLSQAETSAEMLGDERRLARVSHYMVIQSLRSADYAEGIRLGERALAIGRTLGDPSLEVPAVAYLGLVYSFIGDYERAIALLERNVERLRQGELVWQRFGQTAIMSSFSAHTLARCLAEIGEFDRAISLAEEALRIAEAAGQPWTLGWALVDAGRIYLGRGAVARAIRSLEQGLELCQTREIPVMAPWMRSALGVAYAMSGRPAESLDMAERGATGALGWWQSLGALHLADVRLFRGDIAKAREALDRALSSSRAHKERGLEAHSLRLLAETTLQHSPQEPNDAVIQYREALALAEELRMRPLIAHCHLGLGKLHRHTGKQQEAHEHLITATTMYGEMGMDFWLEKAEAALKEPGPRAGR